MTDIAKDMAYVAKYHEDELVREAAIASLIKYGLERQNPNYLLFHTEYSGFSEEVCMRFYREAVKVCVKTGDYDRIIKSVIVAEDVPESARELGKQNLGAAVNKKIEELQGQGKYSDIIKIHQDERVPPEMREKAKNAAGECAREIARKTDRCRVLLEIKNDVELAKLHPDIAELAGTLLDRTAAKAIRVIKDDKELDTATDSAHSCLSFLSDMLKQKEISDKTKQDAIKVMEVLAKNISRAVPEYRNNFYDFVKYNLSVARLPVLSLPVRQTAAEGARSLMKELIQAEYDDAKSRYPQGTETTYDWARKIAINKDEPALLREQMGLCVIGALIARRDKPGALASIAGDTEGRYSETVKKAALEHIENAASVLLLEVQAETGRAYQEEKAQDDLRHLASLLENSFVSEASRKKAGEIMKARLANTAKTLDADVATLRAEHKSAAGMAFRKADAPEPKTNISPGKKGRLSARG